tara:strand:+ start:6468 stop:6743 length:276 start_codon:yes stop_codon:yes gene_type:complete
MKETNDNTPMSAKERKNVLSRLKSREIVKEIMNFGVTQTQIIYIIRLLALELEDVQVMNKINTFLEESEKFEEEARAKIATDEGPKTKIYT